MSNFYRIPTRGITRGAALMNNRFYAIQEVANILGVSTKTLRRWDQRGRFVPTRTVGNQRRYTQEQIQEFQAKVSTSPKFRARKIVHSASRKYFEENLESTEKPLFAQPAPKEPGV